MCIGLQAPIPVLVALTWEWFFIYIYILLYIYILYDVVKSKRRHWLAVTLSFTPCGDRQNKSLSDDHHKA